MNIVERLAIMANLFYICMLKRVHINVWLLYGAVILSRSPTPYANKICLIERFFF